MNLRKYIHTGFLHPHSQSSKSWGRFTDLTSQAKRPPLDHTGDCSVTTIVFDSDCMLKFPLPQYRCVVEELTCTDTLSWKQLELCAKIIRYFLFLLRLVINSTMKTIALPMVTQTYYRLNQLYTRLRWSMNMIVTCYRNSGIRGSE